MVYTFDSKFDRYKATKIYKIISAGALAKQSATRIAETLKIKGLSYRRIEMLHDVRRSRAVEFAKTSDTKLSSGYYFDMVYEPTRALHKMTASEMNKITRDKERGLWETEEERLMQIELEERYVKIMGLV